MDLTSPTIDIIVPAYNAEHNIERCLRSILDQSYPHIRIIVINDGSSDGTQQKIEALQATAGARIVLINQQNAGPSVARNTGLARVTADFIGFVDADDHIEATMFEEMVALVREDVDLVMCGRYDNFPDGSKTPFLPNPRLDEKTVAQHPRLISGTSQFIWDKLYRAQVVHQHTIRFDEHLKYAEDCLFLTQFKLQCNRVRVVREALYNYTESSDGSITKQCNEDWFDIIESMKKLVNFSYARGCFLSYCNELERLSLGYYSRRLRSLYNFGNKKNQLLFFSDYMAFLDQYFPRWRRISPSVVYRNKTLLTAYIITPNAVKKAIRALHITRKKLKRKRVLYAYFRKYLPLKRNQALFISYSGAGVGDSPLYMAAQLAQVGQHDIVFASRSLARDRLFCRLNGLNLTLVNVRSWEYIRRLASSEYVITTSSVPTYFNKRDGQVLVNTWHGTPLKT